MGKKGEKESHEEGYEHGLEAADLEGHPRSGPHRIRPVGRLRCCRRWRHHAGRGHQHQQGLLEDQRLDVERCQTGLGPEGAEKPAPF